MPAPHLLAGALCSGLAASLALRGSSPFVGLAALGLGAAALVEARVRVVALFVALLLAGLWWGSVRLDGLDHSDLRTDIGRAGPALVEVTGPARRSPFAVRVPVRVLRFGREELDEPARLDLPVGRAPPQGARLSLVAEIEAPRGDEDGFDERAYLNRQGVHVILTAGSFDIVGHRGGLRGLADRVRSVIAGSLAPGVSGERRAVIAGVVLGEDEGLDLDLRTSFRASGLYHLLAVSGQNVAYVVGGILAIAWLLGISRWIGELGALAAVMGYLMAVGWQPSVVRAGVAGALASFAWLAGRPRDRWYFLLVGAAVLLAWNPYSLLEPGFQLSFGAVAAIFVLVPRIENWLEGYPIPQALATVVSVSLACGAVTAPILMLHFQAAPLFTVASNAVAGPVVAPLLGLALLSTALGPVLPETAWALSWINGWLAAYLAGCARLFGSLPHAQLTSWRSLAALAGLALFGLLLARLPPPRGRKAAVLAVALAIVLVGWRLRPEHYPPSPHGLRIVMLDVGQGDGILLQTQGGSVLVDEGPPEANVAAQLRGLGIRRLAALVVTHPHRDHVGGAADVVDSIPVGFVLDPLEPTDSPEEGDLEREARAHGVRILPARVGNAYTLGALRIRVLWPDGPGLPNEDPHDHGVVLLASYGRFDALLTGDSESPVTLPLRPPQVELLKVAHHGSSDEGLDDLLELVRPKVALISVGEGNDYGHPAPTTISTLDAFPSLAVYRTDEDGRITVESDGETFSVRTER
ncbi:MAG TPA: ComEC/Rec2 family competence protein [Gaiellaceae bacterium]